MPKKHMRERGSDSGHLELSPAGDPGRPCVDYASDCPPCRREAVPPQLRFAPGGLTPWHLWA